jgi:hypothetical protein
MKSPFVAIAVMIACCSLANGEERPPLFDGCNWDFPKLKWEWLERKCWGPDDYARKCLPCVPPNAKGVVDDYCKKSLPVVSPNPVGCVDDYCPKPCPIWLRCLSEPWYRKALPDDQCGPCRAGPSTHP